MAVVLTRTDELIEILPTKVMTEVADAENEIVILGAGISGMLAAWACEQRGRSFTIVDKGPAEALPRVVKGCVYLHDRCELGLNTREQVLMTSVLPVYGFTTQGLSRLYHQKVWGEIIPYEPNSVDKYMSISSIYSMNDALRHLHDRYKPYLMLRTVSMDDVLEWLRRGRKVISTVSLGVLFPGVRLISQPLWAWQSIVDKAVNGVTAWTVYNVDPDVAWYRMTSMFGNMAIEFIRPPVGDWKVARFAKVASHDMSELDALHKNLMFTGRWGRWQRGFLSHMTYREVGRKFDSGEWR